jgi:hypothetical protein
MRVEPIRMRVESTRSIVRLQCQVKDFLNVCSEN